MLTVSLIFYMYTRELAIHTHTPVDEQQTLVGLCVCVCVCVCVCLCSLHAATVDTCIVMSVAKNALKWRSG